MRTDIQKVVCERERGNSSERSLKTALKVSPKLFTHSRCKMDYEDFRLHLMDISEGWEDPDIINGTDYSCDCGPTYVSSARRRQEARCSPIGAGNKGIDHKSKNENTNAIYRFLRKNLGRPFNDVYSEFCEHADSRSTVGSNLRENVRWAVAQDILMWDGKPYQTRWGRRANWWEYPHTGLYVHPETGILCEGERRQYAKIEPEVANIKWYGDTWFQLDVIKDRNLECRCRNFKVPLIEEKDRDKAYYRRYENRPAVCIHGNEPTPRPIWYVVKYLWHQPNEVYKVVNGSDWEGKRYDLKDHERKVIFYRDVPEVMMNAEIVRKKVANKKELAMIRAYIANGAKEQTPPKTKTRFQHDYWV